MADKKLPPAALDVIMQGHEMTIRDFFNACVISLWEKDEGFSGKYALGNSGWDWDIMVSLKKAGYKSIVLDEKGDFNYKVVTQLLKDYYLDKAGDNDR